MSKDKRIKAEISKLNRIFKNISADKKKLCQNLIKNAAFMAVTLEDLQEIISDEGPVNTFTNGNGFKTLQEHPAQRSYTAMVAKYSSVIKQLQDLLPDNKTEDVNKAGEALAQFVAKGKPGDK